MALALTGELSFGSATAVLEQARAALADENSGPLEVDLAGITRSDSAGLALLLELTRNAKARGRELRVVHAPDQLRRLAEFFGLSGLIALN